MNFSLKNKTLLLLLLSSLFSCNQILATDKTKAFVATSVACCALAGYTYHQYNEYIYNQLKGELLNALDCNDITSVRTVLAKGIKADGFLTYALKNNCSQAIIELLLIDGAQVSKEDTELPIYNRQIKQIIDTHYSQQLWGFRFKILKVGLGAFALGTLACWLKKA
jgi:hypothetical protein